MSSADPADDNAAALVILHTSQILLGRKQLFQDDAKTQRGSLAENWFFAPNFPRVVNVICNVSSAGRETGFGRVQKRFLLTSSLGIVVVSFGRAATSSLNRCQICGIAFALSVASPFLTRQFFLII